MNNRDIYAHKYVHAYVHVLTYACTQSTHAYLSCNVGIPWEDIIVIWELVSFLITGSLLLAWSGSCSAPHELHKYSHGRSLCRWSLGLDQLFVVPWAYKYLSQCSYWLNPDQTRNVQRTWPRTGIGLAVKALLQHTSRMTVHFQIIWNMIPLICSQPRA